MSSTQTFPSVDLPPASVSGGVIIGGGSGPSILSPAVRVRVLREITTISTTRRTIVAPVSAKTYPKRNDGLDAREIYTCINVGHRRYCHPAEQAKGHTEENAPRAGESRMIQAAVEQ